MSWKTIVETEQSSQQEDGFLTDEALLNSLRASYNKAMHNLILSKDIHDDNWLSAVTELDAISQTVTNKSSSTLYAGSADERRKILFLAKKNLVDCYSKDQNYSKTKLYVLCLDAYEVMLDLGIFDAPFMVQLLNTAVVAGDTWTPKQLIVAHKDSFSYLYKNILQKIIENIKIVESKDFEAEINMNDLFSFNSKNLEKEKHKNNETIHNMIIPPSQLPSFFNFIKENLNTNSNNFSSWIEDWTILKPTPRPTSDPNNPHLGLIIDTQAEDTPPTLPSTEVAVGDESGPTQPTASTRRSVRSTSNTVGTLATGNDLEALNGQPKPSRIVTQKWQLIQEMVEMSEDLIAVLKENEEIKQKAKEKVYFRCPIPPKVFEPEHSIPITCYKPTDSVDETEYSDAPLLVTEKDIELENQVESMFNTVKSLFFEVDSALSCHFEIQLYRQFILTASSLVTHWTDRFRGKSSTHDSFQHGHFKRLHVAVLRCWTGLVNFNGGKIDFLLSSLGKEEEILLYECCLSMILEISRGENPTEASRFVDSSTLWRTWERLLNSFQLDSSFDSTENTNGVVVQQVWLRYENNPLLQIRCVWNLLRFVFSVFVDGDGTVKKAWGEFSFLREGEYVKVCEALLVVTKRIFSGLPLQSFTSSISLPHLALDSHRWATISTDVCDHLLSSVQVIQQLKDSYPSVESTAEVEAWVARALMEIGGDMLMTYVQDLDSSGPLDKDKHKIINESIDSSVMKLAMDATLRIPEGNSWLVVVLRVLAAIDSAVSLEGYWKNEFLCVWMIGLLQRISSLLSEKSRRLVVDGLHEIRVYPKRQWKAVSFCISRLFLKINSNVEASLQILEALGSVALRMFQLLSKTNGLSGVAGALSSEALLALSATKLTANAILRCWFDGISDQCLIDFSEERQGPTNPVDIMRDTIFSKILAFFFRCEMVLIKDLLTAAPESRSVGLLGMLNTLHSTYLYNLEVDQVTVDLQLRQLCYFLVLFVPFTEFENFDDCDRVLVISYCHQIAIERNLYEASTPTVESDLTFFISALDLSTLVAKELYERLYDEEKGVELSNWQKKEVAVMLGQVYYCFYGLPLMPVLGSSTPQEKTVPRLTFPPLKHDEECSLLFELFRYCQYCHINGVGTRENIRLSLLLLANNKILRRLFKARQTSNIIPMVLYLFKPENNREMITTQKDGDTLVQKDPLSTCFNALRVSTGIKYHGNLKQKRVRWKTNTMQEQIYSFLLKLGVPSSSDTRNLMGVRTEDGELNPTRSGSITAQDQPINIDVTSLPTLDEVEWGEREKEGLLMEWALFDLTVVSNSTTQTSTEANAFNLETLEKGFAELKRSSEDDARGWIELLDTLRDLFSDLNGELCRQCVVTRIPPECLLQLHDNATTTLPVTMLHMLSLLPSQALSVRLKDELCTAANPPSSDSMDRCCGSLWVQDPASRTKVAEELIQVASKKLLEVGEWTSLEEIFSQALVEQTHLVETKPSSLDFPKVLGQLAHLVVTINAVLLVARRVVHLADLLLVGKTAPEFLVRLFEGYAFLLLAHAQFFLRGSAERIKIQEEALQFFSKCLVRSSLDKIVFFLTINAKLTWQLGSSPESRVHTFSFLTRISEILTNNSSITLSKTDRAEVLYQVSSIRGKWAFATMSELIEGRATSTEIENGEELKKCEECDLQGEALDSPMVIDVETEESNVWRRLWKVLLTAMRGLKSCRKMDQYHFKSVYRLSDFYAEIPLMFVKSPSEVCQSLNPNSQWCEFCGICTVHSTNGGICPVQKELMDFGLPDFSLLEAEENAKICRRLALTELSKLFDRRRPQIVAMWCPDSPSGPWNQMMIENCYFESLRIKYVQRYLDLAEGCSELGPVLDILGYCLHVQQPGRQQAAPSATTVFMVSESIGVLHRMIHQRKLTLNTLSPVINSEVNNMEMIHPTVNDQINIDEKKEWDEVLRVLFELQQHGKTGKFPYTDMLRVEEAITWVFPLSSLNETELPSSMESESLETSLGPFSSFLKKCQEKWGSLRFTKSILGKRQRSFLYLTTNDIGTSNSKTENFTEATEDTRRNKVLCSGLSQDKTETSSTVLTDEGNRDLTQQSQFDVS